jgi:ABC-type multidrug transport system ATPase subunit
MMLDKNDYIIKADSLFKRYNRQLIFKDISFELKIGESLSVLGPNGSGKSTLLQIIAKIIRPTSGEIFYLKNNKELLQEDIFKILGFISPDLNVYEELTGMENINFIIKDKKNIEKAMNLLELFNLIRHKEKEVKRYSSGMKQRLKLLLLLVNDSPILLLDEPGSNLDNSGKDIIYNYLDSIRDEKIIVIATNEEIEEKLCKRSISIV